MSVITAAGERRLILLSGRSCPGLAAEVAAHLGTQVAGAEFRDFANSEMYVRFTDSVRGCDVFVLQCHATPINHWIMEQLIMVDALKRASAKHVTVVAPFFGYARQDKKHRGREPISARLIADLFKTAGADRLIVVDLHTAQIQGFFNGPVDHLHALPLLADHIATQFGPDDLTIVAPDAGRVRVAERWTDRIGCPLAIIHKRRDPDRPGKVSVEEVVGEVADRTCVIVDDMIDTGGTVARAAEALAARGAADVIAAATHGVFSAEAAERLAKAPLSRLIITNTLPLPGNFTFPDLTVLSIAPMLARAIHEIFTDGSVTSLFEGQS